MNFMENLASTLKDNNNVAYTENGAAVYATSGKALVDLNFAVATLRKLNDIQVVREFNKAYQENPVLALRWLFFARDVRGGLGERRLFRLALRDVATKNSEAIIALLPLIQEFGRWDDVCALIGVNDRVDVEIYSLIRAQLNKDSIAALEGKSISLLAKWLPSVNTSSQASRALARTIAKNIGLSEVKYRKMLVGLRSHLNLTETAMASNEWNGINYEAVPSRANLKYNDAFLRHDETRRRNFLAKVVKGTAKMHASTLYPHEIFAKYENARGPMDAIEGLWKNLPNEINPKGSTIVVADGSGSMSSRVPNTQISIWAVAHALATYFAERAVGEFKDKYITFSERPQLVDFSGAKNLYEKFMIAKKHNEVANTNIEAVFDLILTTATYYKLTQEQIPANILIISDMEFDMCAVTGAISNDRWGRNYARPTKRLFTEIADRYAAAGYKLPKLIFWRVDGKTGAMPVIENEMGVALMSGYSPSVIKALYSDKTDPYQILLDVINNPRYDVVENAITPCYKG